MTLNEKINEDPTVKPIVEAIKEGKRYLYQLPLGEGLTVAIVEPVNIEIQTPE